MRLIHFFLIIILLGILLNNTIFRNDVLEGIEMRRDDTEEDADEPPVDPWTEGNPDDPVDDWEFDPAGDTRSLQPGLIIPP